MKPTPLHWWHDAVARNDLSGLETILADDAVFLSPAVHTPQAGRDLVAKYLRAALMVLNGPKFRYVEEWVNDHSAVLEFEADLGGVYLNGIDLIRWNEAGLITQFKVMIRPLKGLNAIIPLMAAQLQPAKG